jgi:hypothetical protein
MGKVATKPAVSPYIPQVLVTVRRGLTDSTPVMVYPWEVPILEIIHGEGNIIEENNAETERWLKRTGVNVPRDTVVELHAGGTKVTEAYDPSIDIAAEFLRMQQKYGMHADMPQSNVEFVYGALKTGQFEAAVLENLPEELRAGREARILREGGAEQLSGAQVRAALDQRKVPFKRTASLSTLRALLNAELEEERDAMVDEDQRGTKSA